jgi:hypothetical protein
MKSTHYDLSDLEFEQQFAACTLDPAVFSHEAHLRLAWIHIKKSGADGAVKNINAQLVKYVNHLGAQEKYNKTLTVAAVRAVNHFMQKSAADNFQDFISEFPRLIHSFKELIAQHYSTDIFNSEKAKADFLEPDLLAF